MSKKKKIIVLSSMIALLAVTAVLNFVFTGNLINPKATETLSSASYFAQYRSERQTKRNEELLQLDAVIASAEATETDVKEALSLKTELTKITEREMLLESLIKAYGFEDVVVVMGIDSDNVNVIAKSANLTLDDTIKIYTIIQEENIASPENVKIIPIS